MSWDKLKPLKKNKIKPNLKKKEQKKTSDENERNNSIVYITFKY